MFSGAGGAEADLWGEDSPSLSFPPKVLGRLCSSHPLTLSGSPRHNKIRFLLAGKSCGRLPIGYTWGLAGLESPEPPEVRVQRLKVCQGMEKEQMTPFDLYQRGLRFLPSSAEPRHSDGAERTSSHGAPEEQGLEGRPLLSPQGTRLGKKQCQRGGWERPVTGQRRREVGGGGGGRGSGRVGTAHPPPPAATGFQRQSPRGRSGRAAVGVRPCPAGSAGNTAAAWGSRGV